MKTPSECHANILLCKVFRMSNIGIQNVLRTLPDRKSCERHQIIVKTFRISCQGLHSDQHCINYVKHSLILGAYIIPYVQHACLTRWCIWWKWQASLYVMLTASNIFQEVYIKHFLWCMQRENLYSMQMWPPYTAVPVVKLSHLCNMYHTVCSSHGQVVFSCVYMLSATYITRSTSWTISGDMNIIYSVQFPWQTS